MASFASVPGLMVPGFAQPGEPVTVSPAPPPVVTQWKYTGGYPVEYPQYLDATAMTTLSVQPGSTYVITPVGGDPGIGSIPGDGRWIPA